MNSETGYARKADSTTTPETLAAEIAREALFGGEFARTDVVIPVNGSAPYSCVMFHGQRITFHDGEFTLPRTAGTEKAAAYAGKINDAHFELAKKAALAALTAPDRVGQVVAWLRDSGAWGLLERVDRHIIADAIEAGEHGGSHAGE